MFQIMPFLFRLPNRFHVYLFFVCFLIGLSSNVLALDQFCDYLYYMASVCIIWHLQNPCIKTCSHTFALLFSFVNVSILAHFRLMLRLFLVIAYSAQIGRSFGTMQNHLSSFIEAF